MSTFLDSYKHKGLRAKLVKTLKGKGDFDPRVLKAIAQLPRHFFLDRAFAEWAYRDAAFPIDAGQTISQPYTVAHQSTLLDIKLSDKILEIGTGSGYQSCILSMLGARVYSIERQKSLFDITSEFLPKIGFQKIRTFYGDGYKGVPRFAKYDKILVTAGADQVPLDLIDQLADGGIMVIPIGDTDVKSMLRITKSANGKLHQEVHGTCQFVPFLEGVSA